MIVWVLQVELFNTNLMIKNMIIHYSLVMVSSDVLPVCNSNLPVREEASV